MSPSDCLYRIFLEYDVLISFLLEEAKVPYWLLYLGLFGGLLGLAFLFAIKRLAKIRVFSRHGVL